MPEHRPSIMDALRDDFKRVVIQADNGTQTVAFKIGSIDYVEKIEADSIEESYIKVGAGGREFTFPGETADEIYKLLTSR